MRNKKPFFRYFVVAALAVVVFGLWKLSRQTPVATAVIPEITVEDWTRGAVDSQITLVEYLDFQCPACGAYYPLVSELFREYGNRVQFVARHFPITSIHRNAMPSAKAAEAAGKQGKFWEMHDMLFESQREWSNIQDPSGLFLAYAEDLGLDKELFLADYQTRSADNKINVDRDSALAAGVNGTPTFFINGHKIDNPRSYDEFKLLLENELNK